MGTEGTLLGDIKVPVEVDYSVWAGINAESAAFAFSGVKDNNTVIISLIDCLFRASGDTGGVITVLVDGVHIGHLDLGDGAPNNLFDLCPELPGVGLGFGGGRAVAGG